MGITTEEFFENVYKVIFSPKDFFENKDTKVSIRLAIGVIVVMAAFNVFASAIVNNSIYGWSFIFTLIKNVITSIIMWFITALGCEYCAKIFDKSGKLSKLLYFSAFATIPTILFAPLCLLKNAGEPGYIISVILGMLLYIWTLILFAYSIKSTYDISLARAFMFIFLPIISFVLMIYQCVDFYYNMMYIFSI